MWHDCAISCQASQGATYTDFIKCKLLNGCFLHTYTVYCIFLHTCTVFSCDITKFAVYLIHLRCGESIPRSLSALEDLSKVVYRIVTVIHAVLSISYQHQHHRLLFWWYWQVFHLLLNRGLLSFVLYFGFPTLVCARSLCLNNTL